MLSTTLYCTCILFVVVKRSDSFSSVHGIGKCRIQRVDFIRHRPRESRVRPLLLPTFHPVLGAAGVRNEDIEVQDNSTFDGTASLQEESGRSPVEEEVTLIASSKANALAADSVPARTTTQSDPSYRSLILFTATTVLIWLSEPLLSVVDTTVVGLTQTNAVTQLAALGPATTLMDSLIYATYFLSITTTNRIASELAMDDTQQLQKTTSQVLTVAALLGIACTFFCWTCAIPVLQRMGTDPSLMYFASRYVWIRASTAVFAVTGVVLQSICLASLDTRTPALAVAVASVTNLVGDIALRGWGVLGAATATAAASTVSALILFRAILRNQWKSWNTEKKPLWQIPDRKSMLGLLTVSGPIFFVMVSKIFCYGAMTLRCTEFGVTSLAAQSILMRIFFFFACFGDSFSQSAQSFLPASLYPKRNPKKFARVFQKLLILSGIAGVLNSQASALVLRRCGKYLLSSSAANGMADILKSHAGYMSVSILLHPFIMLLEGLVLASRDFKSLWLIYATTVALHIGILKALCDSFTGVWRTFVLFQTSRLVLYSWRVWRRQRHETNSASLPEVVGCAS